LQLNKNKQRFPPSFCRNIIVIRYGGVSLIEKHFDIPFLANLALREKQIQQNYRPVIAVHKWFARRPGTLFRGLLLSEFGDGELQDLFYESNCLNGITVADPFMGGGTPVIEANRLGCDVIGCDINPMACWIVERELADLNLQDFRATARNLIDNLKGQVGGYYYTRCNICGNEHVPVKYFLWVKTLACEDCGQVFDLFPGYTLASNNRHPNYILFCGHCGQLNEVDDHNNPGVCADCGKQLIKSGPASRNRCACPYCGTINRYPRPEQGPLQHRMVAIEYYCPHCKPTHRGRFFKRPEQVDQDNYKRAEQQFLALDSIYVPKENIPPGDESTRLHRWGYNRYQELFNSRQLLGLELSSRLIMALPEGEVKSALATNLSDLLRYQNMLCRYDTRALKSLDIFSVHGFPVSLIQCESNLLGIVDERRGGNIGSGGWTNIVDKYLRPKEYCQKPFEIKHVKGKKIQVPISGERIGRQLGPNCSSDSYDSRFNV
jgi:putative DNA methylase